MKTSTKLRCFGGAIIVFDLWLIGQYNITGIPVLLLTFGVAAVFEALVALRTAEATQTPTPTAESKKPSAIVMYGGGLLFAGISIATVWGWLEPTPQQFVASGAFSPTDRLATEVKQLGFIDQWRFDSCMTDAAKNPTVYGVNTAVRVCRRRFEQ